MVPYLNSRPLTARIALTAAADRLLYLVEIQIFIYINYLVNKSYSTIVSIEFSGF